VTQCEHCKVDSDSVRNKTSMTLAVDTPLYLCPVCLDEYVDFWNSQWDEFYSSQGYPRLSEPSKTATELDNLRFKIFNLSHFNTSIYITYFLY
jgi:hypothetical protein